MELHIWPSDFGLPSVDVKSLQFLACAKMCASPVRVVAATNPWRSPNGDFPVLYVEGAAAGAPTGSVTEFEQLVELLRSSGQEVVIDGELTAAERAECSAYAVYLHEALYPAIVAFFPTAKIQRHAQLHALWAEPSNYATITHTWYSRRLPFLYNLYWLERQRTKAQRFLSGRCEKRMMRDAFRALNLLNAKLGDKKYLLGDKPSSLDALVFGYLAPILRVPLPVDRLYRHLYGCPALVRLVESVLSIYVPLPEDELRAHRSLAPWWRQRVAQAKEQLSRQQDEDGFGDGAERGDSRKSQTPEQLGDFPLRDTLLFTVGALVLSALFAIHTGIVVVEVDDEGNGTADAVGEQIAVE